MSKVIYLIFKRKRVLKYIGYREIMLFHYTIAVLSHFYAMAVATKLSRDRGMFIPVLVGTGSLF